MKIVLENSGRIPETSLYEASVRRLPANYMWNRCRPLILNIGEVSKGEIKSKERWKILENRGTDEGALPQAEGWGLRL